MPIPHYMTARRATIDALTAPPCRICHTPSAAHQHPARALCDRHSRWVDTNLALLGRYLVELQDIFLNPGGFPVAGESVQDNWRMRTSASHVQCEQSLLELAPHLQWLLVWDRMHKRWIEEIREVRFWPGKYYGVTHCVFVIRLSDRRRFVFDPTGLQFGLDWQLLTPYDEYYQRRVHPYIGEREVEEGFVGRNKEWVAGGRVGDYRVGVFAQK
ncbi:hypothetical protein T440DRAFT_519899 [Plenodomus tracheiphilus IPT5]|uniref:Uncharacterized protein n=1 Tax=Plenodomus tracheiphilus IPT5 TaxID=1408161 RepID=A0A6A7AYZ3_9PLEO|nr:hypothetical protein T440DRAFT_519899 [Plenodomus tracheiphilus IPT5]